MRKYINILSLLSLFCLVAATTMTVHTTEGDIEIELSDIESITFTDDSVPEGMVFAESGTFLMGDHYNEGYEPELPTHNVTVSSFYIGQHEVTQGEYHAIMGSNPAHNWGVGSNFPVYYITWYDAVEYCNARSTAEGLTPCYSGTSDNINCDWNANGYRLPTEAEWEYAARGGQSSTGDWHYSGSNDCGTVAWYWENSHESTYSVGTKASNDLNIYDMSGNVREWCWDWHGDYNSTTQTDPHGAASGSVRVLRGGSWYDLASNCRVACRSGYSPLVGNYSMGFRVVRKAN